MSAEKMMNNSRQVDAGVGLSAGATADVSGVLRRLLADVFALFLKTKNFHWHMTGPHFRDYHLLLDEQAEEIFAMTDAIAERARKLGGSTLRSIGGISRNQRLKGQRPGVPPRSGHARRVALRQPPIGAVSAFGASSLQRAPRSCHGQSDRELDRRNRTAHLVPF